MSAAIECKVDYIGLVFYEKSPRNVTIENSKKLLHNRNKYSKIVALTVDPDDNFIEDLKKILNLTIFNFTAMKLQKDVKK